MIVPLFGVGLRGKSPTVNSQSRVNCYVERSKDADKSIMSIHGTPGLELFVDLDALITPAFPSTWGIDTAGKPIRALVSWGNLLAIYKASSLAVLESATHWGLTAGPFGIDRLDVTTDENKSLFAAGYGKGSLSITFPSSGLNNGASSTIGVTTDVSDGDAPSSNSATFEGGNIIVNQLETGRYYISADGLAWDALDFASAESFPDNLVRVFVDGGTLHLFGSTSTEFHQNTGAADFPYAPIRGATVEWGLAAKWSLTKFDNSMIFLGANRLGQRQVIQLRGYQATVISDQELDHIFSQYTTVEDATAFSYNMGGHPFYQINFTIADASWLYDGSTQTWSQLKGADGGRHIAEMAVNWNGETYATHYNEAKIYKIKPEVYDDNGEIIPREITTRHFFKDYERVFVDMLQVDFEVGVGLTSGQGSDPQVMLQISKDNGKSWGSELWRSLGKIGETNTRVIWRQLGSGRDWLFRFRLTDPVRFVITGAALHATPGVG